MTLEEFMQYAADAAHLGDASVLRGYAQQIFAERDAACEELELTRGLIEGEPWAGAVMRRERDAAREQRDDLQEALRLEQVRADERDDALAEAASWRATAIELREHIAMLRAEVAMLRGVGCREQKLGEPESGPCGVCLLCAEERGARWALDAASRSLSWSSALASTPWLEADEVCHEARQKAGK